MHAVTIMILFSLGAVFGSFLNVLIHRLPLKQSILLPASHCPACRKPLRAVDNIPILSFILLGGRCRYCRYPIPYRYIIVEIINALLWVALYNQFGISPEFVLYTVLFSILIVCAYTDLDHYRILNSVVFAGFLIALFLIIVLDSIHLKRSVAGMLVGALFMLFWAAVGKLLFNKTALGMGDIKLTALIGLFTGPQNILLIMLLAFLLASFIGIINAAINRRLKDQRLPLAPFIAVASIIITLYGNQLIQRYLELLS